MSDSTTFLCIHGYGMRGFFWDTFRRCANEAGFTCIAPDLDMKDIDSAVAEVRAFLDRLDADTGIVLGHSLGGTLAALAVAGINATGADSTATEEPEDRPQPRLAVLSSPWGTVTHRRNSPLRLLARWKLIPQRFVRARFFGRGIPQFQQKRLFDLAVRENEAIRSLTDSDEWFHSRVLGPGMIQRGTVIAFKGDRIVPPGQTARFAAHVGLPFHLLDAGQPPGHDDLAVDEALCRRLIGLLTATSAFSSAVPSRGTQASMADAVEPCPPRQ